MMHYSRVFFLEPSGSDNALAFHRGLSLSLTGAQPSCICIVFWSQSLVKLLICPSWTQFPTVAALCGVPQEDMAVLREDLVEAHDVEISHTGHHDGVRVSIVHGCFTAGKGRWSPKPAVVAAEVAHRISTFVLRGRVCDRHVLFAELDVFLSDTRIVSF